MFTSLYLINSQNNQNAMMAQQMANQNYQQQMFQQQQAQQNQMYMTNMMMMQQGQGQNRQAAPNGQVMCACPTCKTTLMVVPNLKMRCSQCQSIIKANVNPNATPPANVAILGEMCVDDEVKAPAYSSQ